MQPPLVASWAGHWSQGCAGVPRSCSWCSQSWALLSPCSGSARSVPKGLLSTLASPVPPHRAVQAHWGLETCGVGINRPPPLILEGPLNHSQALMMPEPFWHITLRSQWENLCVPPFKSMKIGSSRGVACKGQVLPSFIATLYSCCNPGTHYGHKHIPQTPRRLSKAGIKTHRSPTKPIPG